MDKNVYVFEGKTSTEAIEKGLKELNVSKNKVEIKILEQEDKRSFFSILTPRVVKVEMKLKEHVEENKEEHSKQNKKNVKTVNVDNTEAIEKIDKFLKEFSQKLPTQGITYDIKEEDSVIKVNINGEETGYLIGYRGEVLNSLQTIISNIASKTSKEKVRVILNIGGFREKREKDLQNLAVKIASTVIKTRKPVTLEPMTAYERKIIHTKLQENDKVKTHSVGEEPYRKVVVSLK